MVCYYLTSSGCRDVSLKSASLKICLCTFSWLCLHILCLYSIPYVRIQFLYVCILDIYHWCVCVCVCVCACVCVCVCLRGACHVHSLVSLILASPNLLCWTVRMWSCWVWLQTACRAVQIQRCSIIYAWEKTRLFTCTPLICYTGRFL